MTLIQKLSPVLLLTLIVSLKANGQSYDQQYQICSKAISKLTQVDSLYFSLVQKRDSCLLGVAAPDFEAITLDNKTIKLAKLKGQVVVINFWFTRCQPCVEEMPALNKLVEQYAHKNVTFVSFTYDSSALVRQFLKKHSFKFDIVADNDEVRSESFKLFSAWPYTVIISKEGKIVFMQSGSKGIETFAYFDKILDKQLNL